MGVWWLDGVDVCVMAWCQTLCHCQCLSHQPIPQWSAIVQCVSKPFIVLLPLQSVCWCCCVVPLFSLCQIHFSLTIGFGDDVIAEPPSHPCLVIHNTVCHVTPCVFLLKQCSFNECLLCLWNERIHRKSVWLCKEYPQWLHKSALIHTSCFVSH